MHPQVLTERRHTFKGNLFWHTVLRLLGWRVNFTGYPANTGVVVIYPHTSNWDLLYLAVAKFALGVPAMAWAKDALFRIPVFGWWLRHIGLVPVDRTHPSGHVGEVVCAMREAEAKNALLWLVVAPEGTRRCVPGWRTGFYRVAVNAGVPIGVAALDYAKRTLTLDHFFLPSGDPKVDMAHVARLLGPIEGHIKTNMSPIQLLEDDVLRDDALVCNKLF